MNCSKLTISSDVLHAWHLGDLLHREDGPAVIRSNGTEVWYRFGKIHREDGPAIIHREGSAVGESWYYEGNLLYGVTGPKNYREAVSLLLVQLVLES